MLGHGVRAAHASPYSPPSRTSSEPSEPVEIIDPAPATDDDNATLPAEGITADELEAQAGVRAELVASPEPVRDFMRPEGVEDPFPDRVVQAKPNHAAILLGLGGAVAIAATVTARLTLLPHCADERNAMTCSIPDRADIGVRIGRLVGTVAFSIGGAAFGAFGGRELAAVLRQRVEPVRARRIAVGIGTTSTVLGLVGMVAGATLLGVSAQRAVDLAGTFQGVTTLGDADVQRLDRTVAQVRTARIGLMLLAASPALLATGVALLVHRPRPSRLSLSPMASRRGFGLSASLRF
jgi:hypothetical protein